MRAMVSVIFGGAIVMSGCSGVGVGNVAADPAAEARAMAARFDAATIAKIDVSDLPTVAHLKGIVGADLVKTGASQPDEMLIGTTEFVADFTNGSLEGTASNFALYDRAEANGAAEVGQKNADLSGSLPVTGRISGTSFTYTANGALSGPAVNGGAADVAVSLVSGAGQVPVYLADGIVLEPVFTGMYALGGMGEPVTEPVVVVDSTRPVSGFATADGQLVGAAMISGSLTPTTSSALVGGTLQDGALLVVEP